MGRNLTSLFTPSVYVPSHLTEESLPSHSSSQLPYSYAWFANRVRHVPGIRWPKGWYAGANLVEDGAEEGAGVNAKEPPAAAPRLGALTPLGVIYRDGGGVSRG